MDRVKKIINVAYAHDRGYFGEGVGVAVMDTGISPHPDFEQRIAGFRDFVGDKHKIYDDNGHGTHVAGIIGGGGHMSNALYRGIAPACHFVAAKVLDRRGNGNTNGVVEGVDWLIEHKEEYSLRIINISVGMIVTAVEADRLRLLAAVEYAWDNGLVVVAAAGNNGPGRGSVTIPGVSPKIITVGCFDDTRNILQESGLKPNYSGQGPTKDCVVKPELVLPGTNIVSCSNQKNGYYTKKSGTSMSAPIVSGSVALLLSKYPRLTPAQVKLRIYERAVDLGLSLQKQGWGTLDIKRLL